MRCIPTGKARSAPHTLRSALCALRSALCALRSAPRAPRPAPAQGGQAAPADCRPSFWQCPTPPYFVRYFRVPGRPRQVRLWPAWKCVVCVEGPSRPGAPTPSRPRRARYAFGPPGSRLVHGAAPHIQAHQRPPCTCGNDQVRAPGSSTRHSRPGTPTLIVRPLHGPGTCA